MSDFLDYQSEKLYRKQNFNLKNLILDTKFQRISLELTIFPFEINLNLFPILYNYNKSECNGGKKLISKIVTLQLCIL